MQKYCPFCKEIHSVEEVEITRVAIFNGTEIKARQKFTYCKIKYRYYEDDSQKTKNLRRLEKIYNHRIQTVSLILVLFVLFLVVLFSTFFYSIIECFQY